MAALPTIAAAGPGVSIFGFDCEGNRRGAEAAEIGGGGTLFLQASSFLLGGCLRVSAPRRLPFVA
jgi:hypothetical protein